MRQYNRGSWEVCDNILPKSYESLEKELEALGFCSKIQLGELFDLNVTYWSRSNPESGFMDFVADFGTGDYGEDIYIPDIPSLIMFLKEMNQIGLKPASEMVYKTFSTYSFEEVERALDKQFQGAKKIHYQVSSGGSDSHDMHYIIGEY